MTHSTSAFFKSPLGWMCVVGDEAFIYNIDFIKSPIKINGPVSSGALNEALKQLDEYFKGLRTEFDLPLKPEGTEFQKKVWCELAKIPFGKTSSYGEIAKKLGKPGASRAVGGANNQNPLAIVIPCHRVIGANGNLTGYASGLAHKKWLLAHEGVLSH